MTKRIGIAVSHEQFTHMKNFLENLSKPVETPEEKEARKLATIERLKRLTKK